MATLKARDVMTRKVLTIGPDVPVRKLAEFLIDHRISAAPVVDAAGVPLGVVSEGDLLRRVELGTEKKKAWWLAILADPDDDARGFVKSHGLVAGDVMTRGMIGVDPDAEIASVANLMEEKRIKRVFVLEQGKVAGVITRSDIVKTFARRPDAPARQRADSDIRADIEKEIRVQPWAPSAFVSVIVSDGAVELVGAVASDAQREGLTVLAQRVEGVRAVKDHLVVRKAGAAWAAYAV
ncbi:MAG: CBS domain-containing protein [Alphaproteobacteria bacterium]|nr:CBS domain-containing protein [Alphaproteobacteria bacterium]